MAVRFRSGGRSRKAEIRSQARGENDEVQAARVELAEATMNRTEARFASQLEVRRRAGELQWWAFEPMKLRLARGAWYTGDFVALEDSGQLTLYEVKGHWEVAARVRIKVAAALYPWLRIVAVKATRGGGAWTFEEIKP